MKFKGAIFDLDGVIVDTVLLHFQAWKKMFSEYDKDFTFEDYKNKVDGIPRMRGARAILEDLSEEKLNEAAARKQDYFLEFLEKKGVTVHQSTVDLVKELRAKNIKVAVISSSKNCRHILERASLIDLFEVIITGNDIKKGKPDPDVFILASEKLGLARGECLVVEDAVLGVVAANRAGMRCVGIDRYDSPQRLSEADIVVKDLSEIDIEKIEQLFKEKG
ncbi:MAG: beta-phosphoglucomutase family hydrolase [Candidatus Omnitrophica bacterium]|nr:beta-phosphoglucomutase family hydrolase [Candidatus Omnitrophota bacterium]